MPHPGCHHGDNPPKNPCHGCRHLGPFPMVNVGPWLRCNNDMNGGKSAPKQSKSHSEIHMLYLLPIPIEANHKYVGYTLLHPQYSRSIHRNNHLSKYTKMAHSTWFSSLFSLWMSTAPLPSLNSLVHVARISQWWDGYCHSKQLDSWIQ